MTQKSNAIRNDFSFFLIFLVLVESRISLWYGYLVLYVISIFCYFLFCIENPVLYVCMISLYAN